MSEFFAKRNLKNNYRRTMFIRCACENEILVLDYDGEIDSIDLSMYKIETTYKTTMSLWQKFRFIYHIMRYGHPYTDQVVLEKKQINELKAFLNTI